MSSFRKRNAPKPIPGTRTSAQTGQVITSSGNPSLDVILGGGLPIGSICLIEEDKYQTHAKVLAKYFLAEGVISEQTVFLGSLDDEPAEMMRKLPKPLNEHELMQELQAKEQEQKQQQEQQQQQEDALHKNGLRIAWRYNDLPLVNSEQTQTKIGHHFNLMEHMDAMQLMAQPVLWNDAPNRSNLSLDCSDAQEEEDDNETQGEVVVNHLINLPSSHMCTTQTLPGDDNSFDGAAAGDGNVGMSSISVADVEMYEQSCSSSNNAYNKDVNAISSAALLADDDEAEKMQTSGESLRSAETAAAGGTDSTRSVTPSPVSNLKNMPKIFENAKFARLLLQINSLLREDKYNSNALIQKRLCRICITSLGSPLWHEQQLSNDLLKFLTLLRACVRNALSVCFITMPMHLLEKYDATLLPKIRNLVDYAIELESFAGLELETNAAFKEYNGLLHLRKITAVNTLSAYMPETTDLAFKLRRKKFVIEKLHLPPELQESSNSNGNQSLSQPILSCASTAAGNAGTATLDF